MNNIYIYIENININQMDLNRKGNIIPWHSFQMHQKKRNPISFAFFLSFFHVPWKICTFLGQEIQRKRENNLQTNPYHRTRCNNVLYQCMFLHTSISQEIFPRNCIFFTEKSPWWISLLFIVFLFLFCSNI